MSRRRYRRAEIDREVVHSVGAVVDAALLDVQLLESKRCEGGGVQTAAGIEIAYDEQHVVDDDAADAHGPSASCAEGRRGSLANQPRRRQRGAGRGRALR